jgi:hAT family C-terminal dimerisation region/BED zinc finger
MSRNLIWDYFTKSETDARKAKCNECSKLLSLGSDKPGKQTLHGLKCHLEKGHKELFVLYKTKVNTPSEEPPAKKAKLDEQLTPTLFQMSIPALNERTNKWPDDHPAVQRVEKSIMDLIIVDMLPYSIVAGDAFKRLNFADPAAARRYEPKSEKYFRTTLMPATYEKVTSRVRDLLSEVDWISFTTDGLTNPSKSCSLLSFTGHFLHQSTRQKVILAAMVLENDHTGMYLASKLNEAIETWKLDGKVHMGIRDNAANMISAMSIAKVADFGCMAHTLQLVLHDALFSQTTVENIVKKSRKIVTHFKHSEQACRHLSDCQVSCDVPVHRLIQDVETRWNSTFLMLQRLSEQRKALSLYSVEHGGITMLTKTELELVDRIVAILKPFYDATLEISRDDACISVVIPIASLLLSKLQAAHGDVGLLQMKAALRDAMNRRFSTVKAEPNLAVATLLDPRFKDMYFSVQERDTAKGIILAFLRHQREQAATDRPTSIETDRSDNEPSTSTASTGSGLWDDYDSYTPAHPQPSNAEVNADESELDRYLREPRIARSASIYGYWNCSQFPGLEPAARKYLSAPPTSVASEQLFSAAGQIYSDRRSNLLGENAEKLLFLSYNIRLFNYNY